jgi:uncharacterized spore protein YtfJ
MASKEEHKTIESLIDISVSSLNDLVDVNTVIGKPFLTANGVQIIPFTKVTVGYLSGGGEYGETKVMQADGKPCGFLIEDGKGCRLLKVTDEPLESLMEKAESLLSRYTPSKKAE